MPVTERIRLRRDTAADFAAANPVLLDGEPAYETDTHVLKIGDGVTSYNSLPPAQSGAYVAKAGLTVSTDSYGRMTLVIA